MFNTIYQIIRTARPRQWLKNFSVFAAPLFAGKMLDDTVLVQSIGAFVAFCLMSSASYFLNDTVDAPKDRLHPIKKNRPIASGKLSTTLAWFMVFVLFFLALFYGYFYIGSFFAASLLAYAIIQVSYSFYLRDVIILDSLIVASGFVLRVFAGGLASNTSISSWLALTTIGVSLLMAFGKRRSEKTLVKKFFHTGDLVTRKTLEHYPDALLDSMISMAATYTIITYSFFTFQISSEVTSGRLLSVLPSILKSPKWMMLTIPFVLYGVARYLYIIYEKQEGESPERVLLSDYPLLVTVVAWALVVLSVIYVMPLLFLSQ
jgi:4-hydroxybenzoate polyprenyltransferase